MKHIFSDPGIPKVVRSNNGPHYNSQPFEILVEDFGFHLVNSFPHYLRSNVFIESQVKSVKTILLEAKTQKPDMGLLCLRATPIDHKLPSTAELLLGRPIQDAPTIAATDIQDTPGNQVLTDAGSYLTRSVGVINPLERLDM